ncbi:MAG: hypothetical protein RMK31_08395 [Candidatus Caldarchaeum sp.]|nr:hypothetical protein [Candidatus Caldarchaeum sp.]MDW8360581.1 hypothetical protein [Candidatus Caldarchaeum sp.]
MKVWLGAVLASLAVALTVGIAVMGFVGSSDKATGEVLLRLEKTELYKGQRTLTYTIINNSPDVISFGEPYDIQIRKNGEWASAEWMKDYVWIMILHMLRPGESFSRVVELPENVELGRYRLVKEVMVEATGKNIVLTAEFEVLA